MFVIQVKFPPRKNPNANTGNRTLMVQSYTSSSNMILQQLNICTVIEMTVGYTVYVKNACTVNNRYIMRFNTSKRVFNENHF